jgi:pyruvate dehydrogenase E2 component (dihydrolipoamide acetyltransferase)
VAREFLLPELAESVVEGEIISWLADEGSFVEEDQPLLEVMTDKATVEIPSPYSGVLEKQLVSVGDIVEVHKPIAVFADMLADVAADMSTGVDTDTGADMGASNSNQAQDKQAGSGVATPQNTTTQTATATRTVETTVETKAPSASEVSTAQENLAEDASAVKSDGTVKSANTVKSAIKSATSSEPRANGGVFFEPIRNDEEAPLRIQRQRHKRVLAAPAARKLAREHQLDLRNVAGSGANSRIRVADVRKHLENQSHATANMLQVPSAPRQVSAAYRDLEERTPMRGLRRSIAKQMVASHLQTVRTLLVDEADVSRLVALRNTLKPRAEARGVKLSYMPFIIKAVVSALQAFPMMNASLDSHRDEIVLRRYYNFGLAVATDRGLVVPVIKDVDKKSVLVLAKELHAVAERARAGKLSPDDVRDGTFSITNIGSYRGLFSFPIINVDQAAILGVHRIKKRPVVLESEDDRIVARPMIYLSTSFDHRIVDGAEAAMFTSHLIDVLETPEQLLLE